MRPLLLMLTVLGFVFGTIAAEAQIQGTMVPSSTTPVLVDATLTLSNGRDAKLSGLLGQRNATILSLTFLGCQAVCPTSDLIMSEIDTLTPNQEPIGFVTLTLSPLTDSPVLLAKRAMDIGAGPRRVFATGDPAAVYAVLDGLGVSFGKLDDHPPAFFIVNRTGSKILRVDGLTEPRRLLEFARSVAR